jgi:hypothetical protein
MRNVIEGSVVLRGTEIGLVTDIGEAFVLDCARYCEGLLTEEQVKKKYELSSNAWSRLSENKPLQRAVERAKERRIRTGDAAREKAQHLFITAPNVLGDILNNTLTSPRHASKQRENCARLRWVDRKLHREWAIGSLSPSISARMKNWLSTNHWQSDQ